MALALGAGVPAGSANVIAVCCGIVPSYFANRHWVWGRAGRSDFVREVVPFWVLSLAGLVGVDGRGRRSSRRCRAAGRHRRARSRLPLANLSRVRRALARRSSRCSTSVFRSRNGSEGVRSHEHHQPASCGRLPRARRVAAVADCPPTGDGRASSGCGAGRTPTRRGSGPRCSCCSPAPPCSTSGASARRAGRTRTTRPRCRPGRRAGRRSSSARPTRRTSSPSTRRPRRCG